MTADTNRAEPMKGLAEWLRDMDRSRPSYRLRRWAEEVEASRLPLAGAATSHLPQPECEDDFAANPNYGASDAAVQQPVAFQQRVQPWMMACFGPEISRDTVERNHRFLEESLELVQSLGCTQSEAHQLVDYVFGRLLGDPEQEAGGVMVTLAALCLAQGLDMHEAGEIELARIWTKVDTIRAKQAAKPKHSPLPASPLPTAPAGAREAMGDDEWTFDERIENLVGVAELLACAYQRWYNERTAARNDDFTKARKNLEAQLRAALAAAPGARQPLSDERIMDLARQWGAFEPSRWGPENPLQFHTGEPGVMGLVRAIELRKSSRRSSAAKCGVSPAVACSAWTVPRPCALAGRSAAAQR